MLGYFLHNSKVVGAAANQRDGYYFDFSRYPFDKALLGREV